MKRLWIALLGAAGLAGCTTVEPPAPIEVAPPPPPPRPIASIVGNGLFDTRTGAHGNCAGESVALMRDTPSYHARIVALYGSALNARLPVASVQARAAKMGPGEAPLAASVTCDGYGRFGMSNLEPGSYFLIARVKMVTPKGAQSDLVIMQHLDLLNGQAMSVSLAP